MSGYFLVKVGGFSQENRKSFSSVANYDVALGNRMPKTTADTIGLIIEAVIGETPSGEFSSVMQRFENALQARVDAGENVTDFNLTVCPYVPGIGSDPLPVEAPE